MRYDGIICPVCEKAFGENDDVVVCPDCGTPHHRDCWSRLGHCVSYLQHGSGFARRTAESPGDEPDTLKLEPITCPTCSHKSPPGSLSCDACGQRFAILTFDPSVQGNGRIDTHGDGENAPGTLLRAGTDVPEDAESETAQAPPFSGDTRHDGEDSNPQLDGVKLGYITEYVGIGQFNYLRKFSRLAAGRQLVSWNWAAFFFAPYWFFYRKMLKPGIIFLTAAICLSLVFTQPFIEFSERYNDFALLLVEGESVSEQQYELALSQLRKSAPAMTVYMGLSLALRVVAAAVADRLYKKRVVHEIKRLRKQYTDENTFHFALHTKGGISALGVALAIVAESALVSLASLLM